MDVRQKLIGLIAKAKYICANDYSDHTEDEYIADTLLDNGVTVQEWIPVTERFPEHGYVVLCLMKFGEQRMLQWDNVSSLWLGYGHGDDWQKADVTHWMPLPQPPKGE